MDKQQIFSRLQQITGTLRTVNETADLQQLQRKLATELAINPHLEITGTQSPHEAADAETAIDLNKRFDHLTELLDKQGLTGLNTGSPLVFRRETAFSNNLLGNSVPLWGSGMAATESFGPFLDEHGLQLGCAAKTLRKMAALRRIRAPRFARRELTEGPRRRERTQS